MPKDRVLQEIIRGMLKRPHVEVRKAFTGATPAHFSFTLFASGGGQPSEEIELSLQELFTLITED